MSREPKRGHDVPPDEMLSRLVDALRSAESSEGGDIVIFNKEQADALIEVARWWIALRGVFLVGGVLGSGVKWFALIIGAWLAFKAGLLDWIAVNLTGGNP